MPPIDLFPILAAIGGILMFVAIIWGVTAVTVALQCYSFSVSRLVPLKNLTLTNAQHLLFLQADAWAKKHGFHYVGMFRVQMIIIAAWEHPERCSTQSSIIWGLMSRLTD